MPQIRCAQTGELLAEGSPLEIATAAQQFDAKDILFDDVGVDRNGRSLFDPAAVRQQRAEEIAGLRAVLSDVTAAKPKSTAERDDLAARRTTLETTIAEREARITAGAALVDPAKTKMAAARERVAKLPHR